MKHVYDMMIIGGGPGGYTAALYASRAGLDTIILEKLSAGGQMTLTSQIDNYPGFEKGIDGFTLGISKEKELIGHGVNYCAACDGMFYKGKTVVVVGGGNSAAADAMQLSRICEKVIIVHRRDSLRATKIYHEPLMRTDNIEFVWNSTVSELISDGNLTGIKIKNVNTGEESTIDCAGIFISVGRKPATKLVKGQLDLDSSGYVIADESTRTNIPGVFAVGDVRTKKLRQIVTAVSDGAVAAHFAEEYLAELL